jgi:hypothetical protein
MNIQEFAVEHRLKVRLDTCGDRVIEGRQGQIYEYDENTLGVLFSPPSKTDSFGRWCPKVWNRLRNLGKTLGMDCRQDGDSEGCLLFDGSNRAQVKLAIQIAKVRAKRILSPERAAAGAATLATYRNKAREAKQAALYSA